MATLDTKTKDPFAHLDHEFGDDFNARFLAEDEIMNGLHATSDGLESPLTADGKYIRRDLENAMVGRLLRWQIADGYAFYRVTSIKPFKLQHLKYGDEYRVGYETIRGTTLNIAANMVARDLRMKELFAKK